MKRVLIIGGSGSGKTTLARKISQLAGLPAHHVDPLIFFDNWKTRPESDILEGIDQIISGDRWVFEGSFSSAFPRQISRADTLIFLDIPTHIRLWRVIIRSLKNYGKSLPEHPEDCKMAIRWWLIRLVVNYHKDRRPKAVALMADARSSVRCYHIKTNRDLKRLYKTEFYLKDML